MCVIVYKPSERELPKKSILEECFRRNPDGAGFMWNDGKAIQIRKGFMGFRSFWRALREIEDIKDKEVVMHFRISTQAGVNRECTHPFPLSDNMKDLKKLNTSAKIGVAHNGIIGLTTSYRRDVDYSDTMEFITKYLSLMIKDWSYYKDHNILTLIERLIDSKMCILDAKGHVELIGKFIEDDGIFYSNNSYKPYAYTTKSGRTYYDYGSYGCYTTGWDDDYSDWGQEVETKEEYIENRDILDDDDDDESLEKWIEEEAKTCYDSLSDIYYFDDFYCPVIYGEYKYCEKCASFLKCYASESKDKKVSDDYGR